MGLYYNTTWSTVFPRFFFIKYFFMLGCARHSCLMKDSIILYNIKLFLYAFQKNCNIILHKTLYS